MKDSPNSTNTSVDLPQIVPIVLGQTTRFRNDGQLTQVEFEQKVARLEAEELKPRGWQLLVRDLPDGTTRFLIKDFRKGRVCEMIDCGRSSSAADGERTTETGPVSRATSPPFNAWEAWGMKA